MEGVKTSRFPHISEGFTVGGVTAGRESPERSWARIRTYLIDNPKDDGLIRRQEIWNYQNKNRGVIKSMLKAVPNVPYRIKKPQMDKFSERNREEGNSLTLPRLQNYEGNHGRLKVRSVFSPPSKPRPLGYTKDFDSKRREIRDQINKFETAAKFLGKPTPAEDFSNVKQYDAAKNTLQTISRKYPKLAEQPRIKSIPTKINRSLSPQKKNVSFSLNDLRTDEIRNMSRCSSASTSISSAYSDSVLGNYDGNYGPSSYNSIENSKYSVYDFLNRNIGGDARTLGGSDYRIAEPDSENRSIPTKGIKSLSDKQWFEKVLEDKEIFDMSDYENYARSRPRNESLRNNNVNSHSQLVFQSVPAGRLNLDNQPKAGISGNKQILDSQMRNVQIPTSTRSLQDTQFRNGQIMSSSRPVSELKNQGKSIQQTESRPAQEKSNQKQNVSVPKPSIYSQNQSKSVHPQNNTKHAQGKGNTQLPPASVQTKTDTQETEIRNVSNRYSPLKNPSPQEKPSRTPVEKMITPFDRLLVEKETNSSSRLSLENKSSPTGRLSVEKGETPTASPIQKQIKQSKNTSLKYLNENLKNSQPVNQRLPFDIPRPMPRVPVKSSGYYPIFSSDGRPMKKIGKAKNSTSKVQQQSSHDIIDNKETMKSQLPAISTLNDPNQISTPVVT